MRAAVLALVVATMIGASGTAIADPPPAPAPQKPAAGPRLWNEFETRLFNHMISRPLRLGEAADRFRALNELLRNGLHLGIAQTDGSTYDQLLGELAADFARLVVAAD